MIFLPSPAVGPVADSGPKPDFGRWRILGYSRILDENWILGPNQARSNIKHLCPSMSELDRDDSYPA